MCTGYSFKSSLNNVTSEAENLPRMLMSHHPVSIGKPKKKTELKRNNGQELRSHVKLLITIFSRFPSQTNVESKRKQRLYVQ
jgi:hypothetical protein